MPESTLEILLAKPARAAKRSPLLFIHGAYAAAWCWQPHFLPYFAERGHAAYALSLRGHGGSAGKAQLSASSIADYVDDVAQAVAQISAETGRLPVLVGHSMGGFVAQAYARTRTLPGLALLATVPPEGLMGSALHLFWHHPQLMWELSALQNAGMPPRLDKLRELLFSDALPDAELQRYAIQFQHESERALIDMTLPQFDQRSPLGMPPAIVIGSEHDRLIPPHLVHSAAHALQVRATIFTELGHLMMLDLGWRQVADRLAAWLEDLP